MTDATDRWNEVGARFTELGLHLKQRYNENTTIDEQQRRDVEDALRHVGDALDAGFTTIGDAMRDAEMRDEFKRAGVAVADAVAATFSDVADEIKRATRGERN
jgi:hypothetical protein